MLVDAHTHVACGDDARYPTSPTGVASDWWRHGGTVDELVATLDANDVDRAVVVQAIGAYAHDCRCAVASVAEHPARLALVAALDMNLDEPASSLASLHADAAVAGVHLCGVRLFGVGHDEPTWLSDGRAASAWEAAAELGIVLVPTLFARHLPALAAVIERCPQVPVALDHCAFPDMGDGGEPAVVRLGELPEVHLKVTSYVLEMAERDEDDPAGVVERLVSAFGAGRLCWGSDHPQDQRRPYAGKVELAHRAVRTLDAGDRDAILAGTALRLFTL